MGRRRHNKCPIQNKNKSEQIAYGVPTTTAKPPRRRTRHAEGFAVTLVFYTAIIY